MLLQQCMRPLTLRGLLKGALELQRTAQLPWNETAEHRHGSGKEQQ